MYVQADNLRGDTFISPEDAILLQTEACIHLSIFRYQPMSDITPLDEARKYKVFELNLIIAVALHRRCLQLLDDPEGFANLQTMACFQSSILQCPI